MQEQTEDDDYEEDQKKLDTVREGNETNAANTEDKKNKNSSESSAGLAGLRDIDELGGTDKDDDDEYADEKFWYNFCLSISRRHFNIVKITYGNIKRIQITFLNCR